MIPGLLFWEWFRCWSRWAGCCSFLDCLLGFGERFDTGSVLSTIGGKLFWAVLSALRMRELFSESEDIGEDGEDSQAATSADQDNNGERGADNV